MRQLVTIFRAEGRKEEVETERMDPNTLAWGQSNRRRR
jgi:hypothetical protein